MIASKAPPRIYIKGVVAHRLLNACALLGVGRVGSLEVGAVQLALAAGPDRRLAAGSVCDQEEEEPSHRIDGGGCPGLDETVLKSISAGSATDRGSPARLASRASS